jgi:Holliday junction resolvasome RuvABC endonuclease subunit
MLEEVIKTQEKNLNNLEERIMKKLDEQEEIIKRLRKDIMDLETVLFNRR